MKKISLPKHMIQEISNYNGDEYKISKNKPYLTAIPENQELKSRFSNINLPSHHTFLGLKEDAQNILGNMNDEDVILELFSTKIRLKHLKFFEENKIIHENLMLFLQNFLLGKQIKQKKSIFLSQILLIKVSQNKNNLFEYKYFSNKKKKIPDNIENNNFFLYLIQINNHWALGCIDLNDLKCRIYTLCQHDLTILIQIIPKIHQNFLNITLNGFIMDDSFSKFNESDNHNINCSLILNYILISLFMSGEMTIRKPINKRILKKNQEKFLKIIYAYLMKSPMSPELFPTYQKRDIQIRSIHQLTNQISAKLQVDNDQTTNLATNASQGANKMQKKTHIVETINPLKISIEGKTRNSVLKKRTKFIPEDNSLPKIYPLSIKTFESDKEKESFGSNKSKVLITKNELIPVMTNLKKKIINEINFKIDASRNKNTNPNIENSNNYQNYLLYQYYNNPHLYHQLIDEYNKRYYSHLLQSFGLSDKEYEKSRQSSYI